MASTAVTPSPGRLRTAYLIAYLCGAAGLAVSIVRPVELVVLIGVPNAVMAIYALGFAVRRRPPWLVDLFADSLLQLGFLFTVTAFLVAMLPFALDGAVPAAQTVLAGLGVALTTSLTGLIGRAAFRQFSISPDQAVVATGQSLDERTREFSRQLDTATRRMRETVDTLDTRLETSVSASLSGIEAAGKAGAAALSDTAAAAWESIGQSADAAATRLDGRMQQAFQRGTDSIDRFGQTMDGLAERTTAALGPVSEEMRSLAAELKTVREAAARNEERITRIFESYELMMAKLREAQEAGDRFQEKLGGRIADLVTALEGASRTIETLSADSRSTVGGLGQEIAALRDARTSLSDDAGAFAELRARLGAELNAAVDRGRAPSGADPASLAIDDEAFGRIERPSRDDDVYIPPLRGRPGRST